MKLLHALFFLVVCATSTFAQTVNWKKLDQLNPDNILLDPANPPTKALLLGTFHFDYPNLDGHKTDSSKMMDVLSPRRQKEIRQLVDVVASFKPTRIYVESRSQRRMDSLYNAYLEGKYTLDRDETDQIAFRLAKELNLPKVYAVDAYGFANENYKKYKFIDSMWNSDTPVNANRDSYFNKRYKRLYDASDSVELSLTMLENFLLMADPHTLRRMHGHYMTAGFNTINNMGPDIQALGWYDRNLRIFNKIQQTQPGSADRILVLFGNGHIPIIKHCFQASPEFEVVELKDLTLKMQAAGKLK
ncbi:DUF5694 domain-containing protein [Paraflavitalea soli]|nr:DUF5694 domain-containing protein [Paraflavitalea soli]